MRSWNKISRPYAVWFFELKVSNFQKFFKFYSNFPNFISELTFWWFNLFLLWRMPKKDVGCLKTKRSILHFLMVDDTVVRIICFINHQCWDKSDIKSLSKPLLTQQFDFHFKEKRTYEKFLKYKNHMVEFIQEKIIKKIVCWPQTPNIVIFVSFDHCNGSVWKLMLWPAHANVSGPHTYLKILSGSTKKIFHKYNTK